MRVFFCPSESGPKMTLGYALIPEEESTFRLLPFSAESPTRLFTPAPFRRPQAKTQGSSNMKADY